MRSTYRSSITQTRSTYIPSNTRFGNNLPEAGRAKMRSICLRFAKCRHDTLIQSNKKQQIAIFLQLHVTIRVTSAIFLIRSRHFPFIKLRDCSKILVFLKLALLLLHLNTISTRAFILQKSAGTKMVLFAILMHSFGQRFAFALYQP